MRTCAGFGGRGTALGLVLLAAFCLMAGCAGPEQSGAAGASGTPEIAVTAGLPEAGSDPSVSVPMVALRIAVAEPRVIIAGPQGYCIDRPAARDGAAGAFVLLGSCAAIAGTVAAGAPVAPAVLTASVSPVGGAPIAPQMAELNAFFSSPAGLAALSRSGQARAVRLVRTWGSDGVYYLAAQDRSPSGGQRVQADFWRAVFDLGGHIVTLNVTGLQAQPLSPEAGRATLEAFVRQVRRENRGR